MALRRRRGLRHLHGFTLVEVLATLAFIALVLPAVSKGISICVRAQTAAKARLEAATLADAKLSELVAYAGWDGQTLSGDFAPMRPDIRWTAASSIRDDGLTEIFVVATWAENVSERTLALSTLVYRGDQ